jgi:hypothetical protein
MDFTSHEQFLHVVTCFPEFRNVILKLKLAKLHLKERRQEKVLKSSVTVTHTPPQKIRKVSIALRRINQVDLNNPTSEFFGQIIVTRQMETSSQAIKE